MLSIRRLLSAAPPLRCSMLRSTALSSSSGSDDDVDKQPGVRLPGPDPASLQDHLTGKPGSREPSQPEIAGTWNDPLIRRGRLK